MHINVDGNRGCHAQRVLVQGQGAPSKDSTKAQGHHQGAPTKDTTQESTTTKENTVGSRDPAALLRGVFAAFDLDGSGSIEAKAQRAMPCHAMP